jgi:hypothetical protein
VTRVYLAGPMTGHDNFNAAAFTAAAEYARSCGWEPVNPHHINPSHDGPCPAGPTYRGHSNPCWLRADLAALLTCDAILMLPGWEQSTGARTEHTVAETCGLPIHYLTEVAP